MERTIARLNIAHFRGKLEQETDPARRRTLQILLAEEQEKLRRFLGAEPGGTVPKIVEPKIVAPKIAEPKIVEPTIVEPKPVTQHPVAQPG